MNDRQHVNEVHRRFGRDLHDLLLEHRMHIYPADPAYRQTKSTLNKRLVQSLTLIDRNRLTDIFNGDDLPSQPEFESLMRLLPGSVDVRDLRSRLRSLVDTPGSPPPLYDAQADGLYMKNKWNMQRRMTPDRLVTTLLAEHERPAQRWVAPAALAGALAHQKPDQGDLTYLVAVDVDNRESVAAQKCRVTFAPCDYSEVAAVMHLRTSAPESLALADDQLETNLDGYLRSAIPTSFNVNVVIANGDNELACIRRSSGVGSAAGRWQVGLIEAMKQTDRGLYELVHRALRYEALLKPEDLISLDLTWLGVYRPVLRGHLVAVARVPLSRREIEQGIQNAPDGFEASDIRWTRIGVLADGLRSGPRHLDPGDAHPLIDFDSRYWVDHACLGAVEAERWIGR